MRPTIGRIVLYMLAAADAAAIMARRKASETFKSFGIEGNPVAEGDVFPLIVTREGSDGPGARINGQVLLDGNDSLWVKSAPLCDQSLEPGTWMWPVVPGRVEPAPTGGGELLSKTGAAGAGSSSSSADSSKSAAKVTVVEVEGRKDDDLFDVLLSDGRTVVSPVRAKVGDEWPLEPSS